jgi:transposase
VYLACGSTDMRKSIDGLAAIVIHSFDLDPFSPALFVFCNRKSAGAPFKDRGPLRA